MSQKYLWIPMLSIIILLAACSQAVSTATSLAGTSTIVSTSTATSPPPTNTPTPTSPPPSPTPTVTPTKTIVPSPTPTAEQIGVTLKTDTPMLVGGSNEGLHYIAILKNNSPVTDTYRVSLVSGQEQYQLYDPDKRASYQSYINRDSPSYDAPFIEYSDVAPQEQISLKVSRYIPDRRTGGKQVDTVMVRASGEHSTAALQLTTIISVPTSIELVGRVGLNPKDVFVRDSYAYVVDNSSLYIIDVSNPVAPTEVGVYTSADDVLGNIQSIVVRDNYAYIATGLAGLRVVDVSDPTTPVEVGFYDPPNEIPGQAETVRISDNYAFVIWNICNDDIVNAPGYAFCKSDLLIIDISDPTTPVKIGSYDELSFIEDMVAVDGYIYIAAYDETNDYNPSSDYLVAGLYIIDVSDPTLPVEMSFFTTPNTGFMSIRSMVVTGNYAYLAVGSKGLQIVDVSNPLSPVGVGSYDLAEYEATDVVIKDKNAYLRITSGDLQIIDISNPASPIQIGSYRESNGIADTAVTDDYAYITTFAGGLKIVDVSDPTAPTGVSSYGLAGNPQAVVVADNYAYLADGNLGLRLLDVSNPVAPVEIGLYNRFGDKQGGAWDMAIVDNYAYVIFETCEDPDYPYGRYHSICKRDLYILDVSDPTKPVEVNFYDLPEKDGNRRENIEILGDYAYLIDEGGWLHVLDISNPASPTKVSLPDRQVSDMRLTNRYLYLLSPSGFQFIEGGFTHDSHLDILDPVSLIEIGSYQLPEEKPTHGEMIIVGHIAYISWQVPIISKSRSFPNWHPVEISDPTRPITATNITYGPVIIDPRSSVVDGNYTYLADGKAGLRILDISDPADPIEVDAFDAEAMDVAVSDGYIYLANGSGGLHILRYPK